MLFSFVFHLTSVHIYSKCIWCVCEWGETRFQCQFSSSMVFIYILKIEPLTEPRAQWWPWLVCQLNHYTYLASFLQDCVYKGIIALDFLQVLETQTQVLLLACNACICRPTYLITRGLLSIFKFYLHTFIQVEYMVTMYWIIEFFYKFCGCGEKWNESWGYKLLMQI